MNKEHAHVSLSEGHKEEGLRDIDVEYFRKRKRLFYHSTMCKERKRKQETKRPNKVR